MLKATTLWPTNSNLFRPLADEAEHGQEKKAAQRDQL